MLLTLVLSFPTVVFTVLLGVVLLYWFFVILGALHIDALGASDGALEGAGHGGLDGVGHGGLDGVGHGGLEGAGHGDVDIGGGDGAGGDGGGGDGGSADHHTELGEEGGGGSTSAIEALRLRSVPATVVMSLIITFSWVGSVLGMQAIGAFVPSLSSWLGRSLVFVLAPLVSLPLTSLSIRPLAPFFVQRTAQGRKDLIGKVCVVRTGTVDAKFGEATLEDGGAGVVVRVRVDGSEKLERGDEALIVAWDEEREAFTVAPMNEVMRDKARGGG